MAGLCVCGLCCLSATNASAQVPVLSLITGAVKKVITAIDLKVQQLQNRTLQLQNAEKALENKMALTNLNDISGWLDKEKQLYAGYYQELQTVRGVIAGYELVKNVIRQQQQLVAEYRQSYRLFREDRHFSASELQYMGNVYNGILQQSAENLGEVLMAVSNRTTQMSDGERLQLIHKAAMRMQRNLDDLRQFNFNAQQLSLSRANDQRERDHLKSMYGL
ncbi:MAG: conjugal transfer protein TraI [Bacteroidetes bacterium]|nr:conjugal transfer protein TraI [Bacteroidota bacterium]